MLVPVRLIAVAFGRRLMRIAGSVARQQRRLLVGGGGAPVRYACIDVALAEEWCAAVARISASSARSWHASPLHAVEGWPSARSATSLLKLVDTGPGPLSARPG